jgi:hypothetical protein
MDHGTVRSLAASMSSSVTAGRSLKEKEIAWKRPQTSSNAPNDQRMLDHFWFGCIMLHLVIRSNVVYGGNMNTLNYTIYITSI